VLSYQPACRSAAANRGGDLAGGGELTDVDLPLDRDELEPGLAQPLLLAKIRRAMPAPPVNSSLRQNSTPR
jgi:hypothetical protein